MLCVDIMAIFALKLASARVYTATAVEELI